MNWFRNISISNKLRVFIITTSCALLLVAALGNLISHTGAAKTALIRDLLILTRVVASNSTAAVAFDDDAAADEILAALSSDPDIVAATTFGNTGEILGDYKLTATDEAVFWSFDPAMSEETHVFNGPYVEIAAPIILDGSRIGAVFLRSNMGQFNKDIRYGVMTAAGILVVAFFVAFLLSSWLERFISVPILQLARTMGSISKNQQYEEKVEKTSNDEIGTLIDSFNNMISEIGKRDEMLLEHAKRIEYLAYFDNVTALPNRAYAKHHLELSLAGAKRKSSLVAVLYIDLDYFKDINDSLGHSAGDELLKQVGQRMKKTVRANDLVSTMRGPLADLESTQAEGRSDVVGRIGGDEFIIVLDDICRVEDAAVLAQRILEELHRPFEISRVPRYISGSIGISVYPDDGDDIETLLKHADLAMYHAKDNGRGRYQFFTESLDQLARERMTLEHDLRDALERTELEVWYQPRVDIRSREVVSVEALVRWAHPERGMISPCEFIPVAERSGMIIELGSFVMHEACRMAKQWQDEGLPQIGVSVNLSVAQFGQDDLFAQIEKSLLESSLDGRYLELELTESMVMGDVDKSVDLISRIGQLGISTSIDDFGTGYSSLHRLRQLPVNALKIDRSFVQDMTSDADSDAIVRTIITLAHSLRLRVIAEGVENRAQLTRLSSHDCDEIQGFLFCKPMPGPEVWEWMTSWQESILSRRSASFSETIELLRASE